MRVCKISYKLAQEHACGEFDTHEARRRELEASTPSIAFDKAVEEVKRLESKASSLPKQRRHRHSRGGSEGE